MLEIDELSSLLSDLTLQHDLTMEPAAQNNNNPAADNNGNNPPVVQPPTNPPDAFYQLPPALAVEMRITNYRGNDQGVGVYMNPHPVTHHVLATPDGDACKLCEPTNLYAKYCLGKILHDMRDRMNQIDGTPGGITRVGEKASCNRVMEAEAERLMDLGLYDQEDITQRRLAVYWRVMCGFNTDNDDNAVLDDILVNFARVRLGDINKNCDELGAAVWAVKKYYDDTTDDSNDTGPGMWTLPVVHLLNGHMIHHGYTPIAFHHLGDTDEHIGLTERAAHSDTIHLNGAPAKVENRETVRNDLIAFCNDLMDLNFPIPDDEGPPADNDDDVQAPPAQRRRVLQLD